MIELTTRLVLQTLTPLVKSDPNRQTFRLISGTLVKRKVTDVVPALETTLSGITEVLESLVKSYKTKEGDFMGFQKEYGIQVGSPLVTRRLPYRALLMSRWVVRLLDRLLEGTRTGKEGDSRLAALLRITCIIYTT